MFVILLSYKKSLEKVDAHLTAHRKFLDDNYQQNFFLVSGPRNPRTGGVIISQLTDRKHLQTVIEQDPFHIHQIADYEIIEFNPIKYHQDFARFVSPYEAAK